MKQPQAILLIVLIWVISPASGLMAHPTGNMITVGDYVLWAYISPLDDPDHHACVMIREGQSEPRIFLQSAHPASDFMLYHHQGSIYIIERRYLSSQREFETRILKTTPDSQPVVIWDWFKDKWRIGEGGFFMLSDDEMVFGRYPGIYRLQKGGSPEEYITFRSPVNRIREVEGGQILVIGESSCYLIGQNAELVQVWNNLIDPYIGDAPLGRNQIFDADYHEGKLLLAYWGNRSFDLIEADGKRRIILPQKDPLTPHWVAFKGNDLWLFSSRLVWDGSTPKPYLVRYRGPEDQMLIWGQP